MEQEGFDNSIIKELVVYFLKFRKQGYLPQGFYISIIGEVGFKDDNINNFDSLDFKGVQAKNTYRALLIMFQLSKQSVINLTVKDYDEYLYICEYQIIKTHKEKTEDNSIWMSIYPTSICYKLNELISYAEKLKLSLENRFKNIAVDTKIAYPEDVIL